MSNVSDKNYYKIEYQIGSEEGNWTEIENEGIVEVGNSQTIYARLTYGPNKGIIVSLSIDATEPTVVAKNVDTSQIVRKTQTPLAGLFDITWGSDGTGRIEYSIIGNLNFKNYSFESETIDNLSELELGSYEVTCKLTSPSNKTVAATKQNVKVTKLATTSVVSDTSNNNVTANAIYSGYDLAYFRDLVNEGEFTINGKLMNDINLSNVCSVGIGSWTPIGEYKSTEAISGIGETAQIYYAGIFEGNDKKIENIYMNSTNLYRQALFSILKEKGKIRNLTTTGNVSSYKTVGGIVGLIEKGEIENCENQVTVIGTYQIGGICGFLGAGKIKNSINTASIKADRIVGGIVGKVERDSAIIENCYNTASINATGGIILEETDTIKGSASGGITGYNIGKVTRCLNEGEINAIEGISGGIVGRNYGTVSYCCNLKNVTAKTVVGGIAGNNRGNISYVYNIAEEIKATIDSEGSVGGIVGTQNINSNANIQYAYNTSKISGYSRISGIVSSISTGTVNRTYNIGTLNNKTNIQVGQISGNVYNTSAITNSSGTTESVMKGWNQETITTNLGQFVKKENGLPILNIIVRGITF